MSILICYDDSESARRALSVAQRTLGHEPAVLLHVYDAPQAVLADAFSTRSAAPGAGGVSQDRLESLASDRAQQIIDHGRDAAGELGLEVEVDLREAPPDGTVWGTILTAADELGAELIVAGTRGQTAVQNDTLGSVSGGLVRHSRRPVLIVPAGN